MQTWAIKHLGKGKTLFYSLIEITRNWKYKREITESENYEKHEGT